MADTVAIVGIIATGAVGLGGLGASVWTSAANRRHERWMKLNERRAAAYVDAIAMMASLAAEMVGEQPIDRQTLALLGRVLAFGSPDAVEIFDTWVRGIGELSGEERVALQRRFIQIAAQELQN
jgi:hypothetical protein